MSRIATPDQIIARNVTRLRDARGLTVTRLAEMMGVSRAKVYDYEHRAGRPHAFKWSELIELCAALGCAVFELVLPDEGETFAVPEWWPQHIESVDRPPHLGAVVESPPGREELSEIVFHMSADLLQPKKLDALRQKWLERQAEWERERREEFFEELRELGALSPEDPAAQEATKRGQEIAEKLRGPQRGQEMEGDRE